MSSPNASLTPETTPVIVGIGEITDRPNEPALGLEPLGLMAEALRRADEDAGGGLLAEVDSLDVVNQVTWSYPDLPAQLCAHLGIAPARAVYGPIGGESPIRYLHEAAARIVAGESLVSAICGGEAQHTLSKAQKAQVTLPWSEPSPLPARRVTSDSYTHPLAVRLGVFRPMNVYPFYENATFAYWGQTPREALEESGELWSRYAAVARANPYAWFTKPVTARDITTASPQNRMIAWPYTKLMVANPTVNQGAAILITSLAKARRMGISEDRLVFILGGAAAREPRDFVQRAQYYRSDAQAAVLTAARRIAEAADHALDALELYSCFPCVPKMTRRILGLGADSVPTVTGGLTFFGAPLNNYMTHAACGMVRHLRGHEGQAGLLYGQGEFVTKHHALVVSSGAPPASFHHPDDAAQAEVEANRGVVPAIVETPQDRVATLETQTVLYDRDGAPLHGVAILRLPDGRRTLARVPASDGDAIAFLTNLDRTPVGATGDLRLRDDAIAVWHPTEVDTARN